MNWNVSGAMQELSRGVGGGVADDINLDIHGLAELKKRDFLPTNDQPKYQYTADQQGNYSECAVVLCWTGLAFRMWFTKNGICMAH